MARIAGYDVGGAHLKAALAVDGVIVAVRQFPCPLWKGLDRLESALEAASALTGEAERHVATMTGELADIFPTREVGVKAIVDTLERRFGAALTIWAISSGEGGLVSAAEARRFPGAVGSMNFLATATVVGRRLGEALLVDAGSTTTDIVPIAEGRAVCPDPTDAGRLAAGQLVYQGLTRTAVMAVADRVPIAGTLHTLMNEVFADMADARRVLGGLPPEADQDDTADGRGKSRAESIARLGRMVGADLGAVDAASLGGSRLAAFLCERQLQRLTDAAHQVLSAAPMLADDAPVVGAGIGAELLARPLAARLGRPFLTFGELVPTADDARLSATWHAPAAAAGLLG